MQYLSIALLLKISKTPARGMKIGQILFDAKKSNAGFKCLIFLIVSSSLWIALDNTGFSWVIYLANVLKGIDYGCIHLKSWAI